MDEYIEACRNAIKMGKKVYDKLPANLKEEWDGYFLNSNKGFPYDNKYYFLGLIEYKEE